MYNETRSALIEALKKKANPTELEEHIIDTANELTKNPFDSAGAEAQIIKNYWKYPNLRIAIDSAPFTVQKDPEMVTDTDRAYILSMQLELLCVVELEEKLNGQA